MNKEQVIVGTCEFFNAWKDEGFVYRCVDRIDETHYIFNGIWVGIEE